MKINISESIFYFIDTGIYLSGLIFFFYKAIERNNYFLILLSSFCEYKLGLIAHEGCHNSIPKYYGYIYDIMLGSSEQWIYKHNKHHHLFVNKEKDPDVDITPFIRIKKTQQLYWYHKYQHIYQYFLFLFAAFSLRINGIIYIYRKGLLREQMKIYIPGLLLFIVYPFILYGFSGILFYLIQNMLIGLMYGIIFSVSHVNEKTEFSDSETDFEMNQINESIDWQPGSVFFNYITNGLNYQVVHHLYPNISSYNYCTLQKTIKEKYASKYKSFPTLFEAVQSNYRFIRKMGQQK